MYLLPQYSPKRGKNAIFSHIRASAFTVFQDFWRIFCGSAAKNRAIKATGGCQGSGFASGASRRGCSAPLLSLALPKNGVLPFLGLGFCGATPQEMETAGLHAGLKQPPHAWNQPASVPA
jgi:hypothetical protein